MPGGIDLHIHSTFSDGTFTPEEIVDAALEISMDAIAVCDHDTAEGSLRAASRARARGLACLTGAEIDSLFLGRNAHILCYGADFSHPRLQSAMQSGRACLDGMSDRLLMKMLPDYPLLDADEYRSFVPDPRLGGWKLLQYLHRKRLTRSLKDALPFYGQYGVTYETAGFLPAEEVVRAIHAAGGCAILAHPGVTFGCGAREAVQRARDIAIDGAECFYPKHPEFLTDALLSDCVRGGLCATAGSDFHGSFGSAQIGQMNVPARCLRLNHPVFSSL